MAILYLVMGGIIFNDESVGDYRIVQADVMWEGIPYTITPMTITYEEFRGLHDFTYPPAVRVALTYELDALSIPLSSVNVPPDRMYWVEHEWTGRFDATYLTPYSMQWESDNLSLRGTEYDTLGVAFGDSWAIPYNFAVVTVPEPRGMLWIFITCWSWQKILRRKSVICSLMGQRG